MTREQDESKAKAPFRVLSLDGGGSKGVYTLGVLREIEALAARPLCEVFHLIYGTSTGAIIGSLIALGKGIEEVKTIYFERIPVIMRKCWRRGRTAALKKHAQEIFQDSDFSAFKTDVGIVAANHTLERPMIFKRSGAQAHARFATFKPGFGCKISEAVIASCSAYPFFEMVTVKTENQGEPLLMDGGFVANNPTLFALADAREAMKMDADAIRVLSVGVGSYNEPKRTILHRIRFRNKVARQFVKILGISSTTIEQLRVVLFPEVKCVRVSEAYAQSEYATDFLEEDVKKLDLLHSLGRESYGKLEKQIRETLVL